MIGAMKLQPDDGPRSILGIGPGSDDVVGSRRRSLGDSPKGLGSSLGDHWKKTGRLTARMAEATRLVGVELNWLTKELVNIRFKPKFEKWREPLFRNSDGKPPLRLSGG
ncbi:hypothetical protein BHE74_00040542 [Ensete ventricosum]|nr:hypothetical protein GW17_00047002 [Ensete ventricosum]RWW53000.1 hypothetical protein BHE74_00040542 [Ensete ventricosum]RZS14033.1 hypothetical protein BHM03_00045689 [Ensete ventricosum]